MDTARAAGSSSRPASRASARSDVSQNSAQLQASDEVLRVTRQQARITAEKKKLLARQAAQQATQAAQQATQAAQQAAQAAQQAAMQAEMTMERADLEAQEDVLAAEVEHAQRAYQLSVGSQALSTSERVRAWASASNVAEEINYEAGLDEETPIGENIPTSKTGQNNDERRATCAAEPYGEVPGGVRDAESAEGATRAAEVAPAPGLDERRQLMRSPAADRACAGHYGPPGARAANREIAAVLSEGAARTAPSGSTAAADSPATGSTSAAAMLSEVCQSLTMYHTNAHLKELPRFSGNTVEWVAFHSIYKHSTEVGKISDSVNLLRLQKSLSGAAREAVGSLLFSPANVARIMATLEDLFGDYDEVAYSAVREARGYPKLEEDLNYMELLRYSCKVKNLIATLTSLDRAKWLINLELLSVLVGKLPRTLVAAWVTFGEKSKDRAQLIHCFSDWLDITLKGIKYSGATKMETIFETKRRDGTIKAVERTDKRKPVFSAVSRDCLLCKGDHALTQCESFLAKSLDDRWSFSKENNACFLCLLTGHTKFLCNSRKKYPKRRYHPLLSKHNGPVKSENTPNVEKNESANNGKNACPLPVQNMVACASGASTTLLKTVKVQLIGPSGKCEVYCLLDDGSAVSLLEKEVAVKIGLQGPEKVLNLQGIGNAFISEGKSQTVSCKIKGVSMKRAFPLQAQTVKSLDLPTLASVPSEYVRTYPHLSRLSCYDVTEAPKLIVGQDNWALIISRAIISKKGCDISLSRTKLGYVPLGKIPEKGVIMPEPFCHVREGVKGDELHELVQKCITLDNLVADESDNSSTPEEERALALLEGTTKIRGEKWETELLWRSAEVGLPESELIAAKRLRTLENKLDRREEFAAAYCAKMEEYIQVGYASPVNREELIGKPRAWFLPHFAVTNPQKPGKIRIVFDGRAVSHGVSLNYFLLTGPDFYADLVGILFRFREKEIAFVADIKDMYLRVAVNDEDSYSQLFLWRGMDRENPPKVFRMRTLTFGSRSSASSAQYVKNLNAERFRDEYPHAVDAIKQQCYMDDWIQSTNSVGEARRLIREATTICASGNFQLTRWSSNSPEALHDIPIENKSTDKVDLESSEQHINKILGLQWHPRDDSFHFKLSLIRLEEQLISGKQWPTKRDILRLVMSIFDPMGYLGCLLSKAKMLLQSIWESGTDLDALIEESLYKRWLTWLGWLKQIDQIRIPRHYGWGLGEIVSRQLHMFSDASTEGMCSVAYLRQVDNSGQVKMTFIASRCRVSPLKKLTVPRLELNAALMSARLAKKLGEEHHIKFDKRFMWADSANVIYWATTGKQHYKVYVAHRVAALMELTSPSEWKWVPGKLNPADDGTRSVSAINVSPDGRWFQGPEYLMRDETEWPQFIGRKGESLEDELEKRPVPILLAVLDDKTLVNAERFSDYNRMLRALACALKFIAKCRRQPVPEEVTAVDLEAAELALLRNSQLQHYQTDIKGLAANRVVSKNSSIVKLTPVLNKEGLICVGSRIAAAKNVPISLVFPVVLNDKSRITGLIIGQMHKELNHAGVEQVLSATRVKYWIVNGRQAVKKQLAKCQYCRNKIAKPQPPRMADLPRERLDHHMRPFTNTAIDYFGPYYVVFGRRREIRYGVLFVCLTVRAIHIELAENLTTDSEIQAIRRFVARRGMPSIMYSDNATTLRGAAVELKKAVGELDERVMGAALSSRRIQWKHVPPLSPQMAGAWERLVRSVKTSLATVLKERAPRAETFHTLLLEVEAIVNARPLTHVSLDSRDDNPLTPQNLLSGYSCDNPVPGKFEEQDLNLRKQWRIAQCLSDAFWRTWVKSYLPTLTNRLKWHAESDPLKVGDVVLVCHGGLTRNQWPKGVVSRTFPDKEGRVRVVEIHTGGKFFKRSAARLAKLQVEA